MTVVVLIAWIAMSILFVKRGCSDECVYIGASMMLAAQYVRASMRRNQMRLSEKSAAMAIWLGKQMLGQRDSVEYEDKEAIARLDAILEGMRTVILKKEGTSDV